MQIAFLFIYNHCQLLNKIYVHFISSPHHFELVVALNEHEQQKITDRQQQPSVELENMEFTQQWVEMEEDEIKRSKRRASRRVIGEMSRKNSIFRC
jgi:hypothetical protein